MSRLPESSSCLYELSIQHYFQHEFNACSEVTLSFEHEVRDFIVIRTEICMNLKSAQRNIQSVIANWRQVKVQEVLQHHK